MGLSFQDKLSLVESVGSLRFEAANPNAVPGTRSISLDRSLRTGPHHPNAIPEMTSIEERRDDDIGRDDDIQIVPTYKVNRQWQRDPANKHITLTCK
jgi:hypothetical protein